jgi:kynurenine formamidase
MADRLERLLEAVAEPRRVYDLAQPMSNGMASSPNHPGFRMALLRRHGDMVRDDGGSAANELIVTGGHVGTHVDALAHVSHRGRLHGDVDAADAQVGGRFSRLGIDEMEPIIGRGVLLDVAHQRGADVLPPGYGISADDLEETRAAAGVEVRAGDVVLIRSGWGRNFAEPDRFVGVQTGVPGPNEEAAHWLADRRIRASGADTIAYEQIPPGAGHRVLPVHRVLLVEHGIHIIEVMNLEGLAAAGAVEFMFVLAPLRIVGGTGSPVRPLAVVPE